jgi:predicted RNA-binding protein YlxR (DUF448 family)
VGCNRRDAQSRLARFTLVDGRLAWDPARRQTGRGGYLHLQRECLDRFQSRKPFLRSLRASVSSAERARLAAERSVS